jgi:predicted DNA-binding transcriptional regulator AlpA
MVDDQCLDIRSLAKHLRLSRTTILRLLDEDPHFPKPMKLRSQLRWRMASIRRYEERLEVLAELEAEKVKEKARPAAPKSAQLEKRLICPLLSAANESSIDPQPARGQR